MKKGWVAALLVVTLCMPAAADMLGVEAVDFSLTDVDGSAVSLSTFSDRIVVLVHLNTYCYSCREEVPLLNEIQMQFTHRMNTMACSIFTKESKQFLSSLKIMLI